MNGPLFGIKKWHQLVLQLIVTFYLRFLPISKFISSSGNLIIHDVEECSSKDRKVIQERDMGGLLQLFKVIEVDSTLDNVKLVRREGEKKEGQSRPLKVVFRRKEDRDTVLSNAYKLGGGGLE